jgi:methyltransferase (TIGR00027 family)
VTDRRGFLAWSAALAAAPIGGPLALEAGQPSRTARGAALQRAAHQLLEAPLVFEDPLALRILGPRGAAWLTQNLERYRTERARAMRAFLVMRSCYAEDSLAQAVQAGARQYVVLGAGLDTFACRNPHPQLRVFEVDHPATQDWKRAQLRAAGIEAPANLRFAPVDFEREAFADGLRASGFESRSPAFVSWLGVAVYLSRAAVLETLRAVALWAPGSEVVFDIGLPPSLLDADQQRALEAAAARVANIGEPWLTFFDPRDLAGEMRAMGYRQVAVLARVEANARYFANRADGFGLRGAAMMVRALV